MPPKKIVSVSDLFSDQHFLEKLEEFNSYTNKAILNRPDIVEAYKNGFVIIATEENLKALKEEQLQNCSYDVTLGKYYFRSNTSSRDTISVGRVKTYQNYWTHAHEACTVRPDEYKTAIKYGLVPGDKYIILRPGELILAHTNEFIGGINCINSELRTRSTMRRCGIDICASAGWGDIGYVNRWTLEIKNDTHRNVILPVNVRIGQIVFLTTTLMDTDESYDGNYQLKMPLEEIIKTWNYMQLIPKDKKFVPDDIACTPDEINLDYAKTYESSPEEKLDKNSLSNDIQKNVMAKVAKVLNNQVSSKINEIEKKVETLTLSMKGLDAISQTLETIKQFQEKLEKLNTVTEEIKTLEAELLDKDELENNENEGESDNEGDNKDVIQDIKETIDAIQENQKQLELKSDNSDNVLENHVVVSDVSNNVVENHVVVSDVSNNVVENQVVELVVSADSNTTDVSDNVVENHVVVSDVSNNVVENQVVELVVSDISNNVVENQVVELVSVDSNKVVENQVVELVVSDISNNVVENQVVELVSVDSNTTDVSNKVVENQVVELVVSDVSNNVVENQVVELVVSDVSNNVVENQAVELSESNTFTINISNNLEFVENTNESEKELETEQVESLELDDKESNTETKESNTETKEPSINNKPLSRKAKLLQRKNRRNK